MNQSLVSIIIPVYKVEKYMDKCMDSVLAQTYNNIEIILVDDGSPDTCPMKCDEYAQKDVRIKVIHKENGGLSSARNAGLEVANGDYVLFVDSDDYISPYMIEKMVDMAISYNVDMVSCSINKDISGNIKYIRNCLPQGFSIFDSSQATKYLLSTKYDCSSCNKLFKKDIIGGTRFPIGRYNEDVIFCFNLFQKKFNIANTSEAYYYYRTTPGGLTESFHAKKFDLLINTEEMEKYIYENQLISYMEDIVIYKNIVYTNLMTVMIKKNVVKAYPIEFSKIKSHVRHNMFHILIGSAYSWKIKIKTILSLFY